MDSTVSRLAITGTVVSTCQMLHSRSVCESLFGRWMRRTGHGRKWIRSNGHTLYGVSSVAKPVDDFRSFSHNLRVRLILCRLFKERQQKANPWPTNAGCSSPISPVGIISHWIHCTRWKDTVRVMIVVQCQSLSEAKSIFRVFRFLTLKWPEQSAIVHLSFHCASTTQLTQSPHKVIRTVGLLR